MMAARLRKLPWRFIRDHQYEQNRPGRIHRLRLTLVLSQYREY